MLTEAFLLDAVPEDLPPEAHREIEGLVLHVEQQVYQLFALQQPMASDLRTLLAILRILHEIELTCTRIGMIKQGVLIVQDRLDAVIARTVNGLHIACDPKPKAVSLLKGRDGVRDVREEPDGRLRVICDPARFGDVNAHLVANGVTVSELTPARQTLEEFFLSQ